ncbi:HAD family hydrolase [Sinomonas sp. G460-2]|uniref:HAD family hydrolase n=1 Tax=Sinomonas sp. G460-2 TaxID=3393464 RepID=UPI0039EEC49F
MTTMLNAGIDDQLGTMNRKLIGLDVDGTLVDHFGHMSPAVREAGQALVAAGHEVVVATGRSLGATLPVVELLGIERGYVVSCNGGVTARIHAGANGGYEVIDRRIFDPSPALQALRHRLPGAKYALEDAEGNFLSTERFQDASFGVEATGVTFEDLLGAQAVRLVVFSTDATAEEFGRAVESIGLHGVTYSVGWTAWLDIAAKGVTKASGLERVRSLVGIDPAHTVAVGDGRNDIEMLQWAGRGIAMGQAPDEVKAAADEVTSAVEDDGVVGVMRSLL